MFQGRDSSANVVIGGVFFKSVEDILNNTLPGKETKGKTKQYEKPGTYEDAIKDFESLGPISIKTLSYPDGKEIKIGVLPDGRAVNVRNQSDEGRPTLEVQGPGNNRIKIRYG